MLRFRHVRSRLPVQGAVKQTAAATPCGVRTVSLLLDPETAVGSCPLPPSVAPLESAQFLDGLCFV